MGCPRKYCDFNKPDSYKADQCHECGILEATKSPQAEQVLGSNSTTLLDCKTIQACAELLDLEADRMEDAWNQYIASGGKGPATTYYTIPRAYAKLIRGLAI